MKYPYGPQLEYHRPVIFADETGIPYGIRQHDNMPMVVAGSYLDLVAQNLIAGSSVWSKNGYNNDIGTTTEDLFTMGGLCNFPSGATQMYVYSTSANDAAAGTGARTINIELLTSAWLRIVETVTLNGVAGVTLTNLPYRINRFRLATAGVLGATAGQVYISNTAGSRVIDSAGTSIYSHIEAGYNRARNIAYTVPAGKTLFVSAIGFSVGATTGKAARFTTKATWDNFSRSMLNFFMPYHEIVLSNVSYNRNLVPPTELPEKTDLKVSVVSASAGAAGTADLRGWLEVNE